LEPAAVCDIKPDKYEGIPEAAVNERTDYLNEHYSPFAEEGSFFKLPYGVYDHPAITDEAKNNALSIWNNN
jgi:hypothetical protein